MVVPRRYGDVAPYLFNIQNVSNDIVSHLQSTRPCASFFRVEGNGVYARQAIALCLIGWCRFEIVVDELWTWRVHSGWTESSSIWGRRVLGELATEREACNRRVGCGHSYSWNNNFTFSRQNTLAPGGVPRSSSNSIVVQPHSVHSRCDNPSSTPHIDPMG